jgi:uncharacterized damage-inducible protein DinB
MPTSDPITILLAHDRWATRQILDACSKLTDAQFHQRFEMGPGSLHDTITHMLAAMRTWGDSLSHRDLRPRLEGTKRSIPELSRLLDETYSEFAAIARAEPLDHAISRAREGKTYTFTRGVVITHVATHGMHHRAQCLNMLRHLGVSPLPPSSIAEWSRMADTQQ